MDTILFPGKGFEMSVETFFSSFFSLRVPRPRRAQLCNVALLCFSWAVREVGVLRGTQCCLGECCCRTWHTWHCTQGKVYILNTVTISSAYDMKYEWPCQRSPFNAYQVALDSDNLILYQFLFPEEHVEGVPGKLCCILSPRLWSLKLSWLQPYSFIFSF